MVFCLFQESIASVNRLVAVLFNLKNLGFLESHKCVVCCTEEAEKTIRHLCHEEVSNREIDFFSMSSINFGSYVSSWNDMIQYALEKYGEVHYLNDDIVLFRMPQTAHLSSGIGFLKKSMFLPDIHYERLFSNDYFFCNNIDVFNKYAEIRLNTHSNFIHEIEEIEASEKAAETDPEKSAEPKPKKTVKDFLEAMRKCIYEFLKTIEDESTAIVSGQFLGTEDFFGIAKNPVTFKDTDYKTLKFTRYFNQKIGNNNEEDSVINQESLICGFFIRSGEKDFRAVQANERMGQLLQAHFPKADPLLLLRTQRIFPLSYPPADAKYIAHWDRRGQKWHEGLIKFFKSIADLPFVKAEGLLYRFIAGVNPVICEPDTKYLSPDLVTRKDIMIANLDLNGEVVYELVKYGLPYSFVFYYPEDFDVLEEVLAKRAENQETDDSRRTRLLFVPSKDRLPEHSYTEYLNELFASRYVLIEKEKFDGCVIAEALAAGCCLVLEDGVAVSGFEENVHYIRYDSIFLPSEQDEGFSEDEWSNQSKMCYTYYKQNLTPKVLGIRLLRHCLTLDMRKLMIQDEKKENEATDKSAEQVVEND